MNAIQQSKVPEAVKQLLDYIRDFEDNLFLHMLTVQKDTMTPGSVIVYAIIDLGAGQTKTYDYAVWITSDGQTIMDGF